METRKLQQVGGGTYTVSIPKEWATENRLEPGAQVHLYRHLDGSIVVRSTPKEGGELDAVRVEVTGEAPERAERALAAAHAAGFERVTLAHDSAFTDAQRRAVEAMVRGLPGAALETDGDDVLTVRSLLDASDVSVRQTVAQLRFTALSVHRQATRTLLEADAAHDRLADRAGEADRLDGMLARHVNRSQVSLAEVDRLGTTRSVLLDHHEAARLLDWVASEGVTVAEVAGRLSGPLPRDTAEAVREAADAARSTVESGVTAFLDGPTADAAHDALDRRDAAAEACETIERTLTDGDGPLIQESPGDAVALCRALDALARTADRGGDIAEVALRAATRDSRL